MSTTLSSIVTPLRAAVVARDALGAAAGAGVDVVAGDTAAVAALELDVVRVVGAGVAEVGERVAQHVEPGASEMDAVEVAVADRGAAHRDAGERAGCIGHEDLGVVVAVVDGVPVVPVVVEQDVGIRGLDVIGLVKVELRIVKSRAPAPTIPPIPRHPFEREAAVTRAEAHLHRRLAARRRADRDGLAGPIPCPIVAGLQADRLPAARSRNLRRERLRPARAIAGGCGLRVRPRRQQRDDNREGAHERQRGSTQSDERAGRATERRPLSGSIEPSSLRGRDGGAAAHVPWGAGRRRPGSDDGRRYQLIARTIGPSPPQKDGRGVEVIDPARTPPRRSTGS